MFSGCLFLQAAERAKPSCADRDDCESEGAVVDARQKQGELAHDGAGPKACSCRTGMNVVLHGEDGARSATCLLMMATRVSCHPGKTTNASASVGLRAS